MVLAEAMAAGSPILTTVSGAIPEVVGDAALLVPPYDVDALADALEQILSQDALREDLAARGHERVRSRYDADLVGQQLSAVYRSVTS